METVFWVETMSLVNSDAADTADSTGHIVVYGISCIGIHGTNSDSYNSLNQSIFEFTISADDSFMNTFPFCFFEYSCLQNYRWL